MQTAILLQNKRLNKLYIREDDPQANQAKLGDIVCFFKDGLVVGKAEVISTSLWEYMTGSKTIKDLFVSIK